MVGKEGQVGVGVVVGWCVRRCVCVGVKGGVWGQGVCGGVGVGTGSVWGGGGKGAVVCGGRQGGGRDS